MSRPRSHDGATVLVAGGGTGGHVVPALAVAEALLSAAPDLAVEFVGTARGLEAQLVPAAGWTLHEIEALPLTRGLSPRALGQAVRLPAALWRGTRAVVRLARARGAVAAVCFGGYVSMPLALAARRLRLPLVLHESNAVPGLANRLASRWAAAVAVMVPASAERFAHPERVTVTGMPVREGLAHADPQAQRAEALAAFDLDPQRRTLLVFGGSQGARRLNDAVVASAGRWPDPARLQILHAAGRREADSVTAAWERAGAGTADLLVRCLPFIERMDLAYAAADLVVSRSGASTIGELTVLGLPSVLVPYPHATADHQHANARALADAGAAVVVPDAALDADALVANCAPLLRDDDRRATMAANARRLGRRDAAAQVAGLVLAAAGRRAPSSPPPHGATP